MVVCSGEKPYLEIKISESLHAIGVPSNIKGYDYVKRAIMLVAANSSYLSMITKELYPALAEIFNTTPECIERNIRHCISLTWNHVNPYMICKFFGYRSAEDKPTNSEFIAGVADTVRLRLQSDFMKQF